MGRIKSIDKLYDDLQEDANKISKEFNNQVADEFNRIYIKEASDWYNNNTPKTDDYIRTYQLNDKALLIKKEDKYGKKISFSADKIRPKKGKQPTVVTDGEGKSYKDYSGTLPSYYSWNKKINQNIASSVLDWEEFGTWNFAQYKYRRGHGIFGNTLNEMIKQIDKIRPSRELKVKLPDNIINDLYNLLKNKTKAIMQKRYIEIFYG